jgi:hypothetical protein
MLSATIDAMEELDVATVDIPGAFMQADIDEVVHVRFEDGPKFISKICQGHNELHLC